MEHVTAARPHGAALASHGPVADICRSIKDGAVASLFAATTFAIGQTIAAAAAAEAPIVTFRRFASVLIGPDALATTPAPSAILVGLAGHLCLSAMYGVYYGAYCSMLSLPTRSSFRWQATIGALYGALLWFINVELVARCRYPWLAELSGVGQLALHAVCFGTALGLRYAAEQRLDHAVAYAAPLPIAMARPRSPRARLAAP